MSDLTNEAKAFIVQGLASYMTPTEVVNAVKEEFGIDVSRQTASAYDPNKAQGKGLAQEWRDLFEECRKRFNENLLDIPIANKAYRLNMLDRMARDAEKSKNRPLAAALAEQAAKEMGEVFTNKQKVDNTSSDGSMTPQAAPDYSRLSDDELRKYAELESKAASDKS